ncbi:MAG: TetR/AcrR family transcriptional regulator [Spirochaetia bacterium]|nr:TetR/AcrR family transcriptional regulator [Spirochaetia bacterium]
MAPLFNRKGFAGTSLSDLEAATGLTKGSIYGNFRDKNEVAVEAFRYNYGALMREVRMVVDAVSGAANKLLAFSDFYRNSYPRLFKSGGCAILNTATDADDGNAALRREVVGALEGWKKYLEKIVQDGTSAGEFGKVDPEPFACRFIAIIEGSIMLAKTTGEPRYLMHNLNSLSAEIRALGK